MVKENKIDAIISDNRYGLHHPEIRSVIMTHQLKIKAPFAFVEKILQKINYRWLQKFSACWVPDEAGIVNLAGELSHPTKLPKMQLHYLGGLSRLEKRSHVAKKYSALIILSGPEPQRSLLEKKLLEDAESLNGKILLLRGLPENTDNLKAPPNVVVKNHLPASEMGQGFEESEYIISRSGYTTVMDICKLQKKSILIPTPGQTEQEYLAKHLHEQHWCMAVEQQAFFSERRTQHSKTFDYKMPVLSMNEYEKVIETFIRKVDDKSGIVKS